MVTSVQILIVHCFFFGVLHYLLVRSATPKLNKEIKEAKNHIFGLACATSRKKLALWKTDRKMYRHVI